MIDKIFKYKQELIKKNIKGIALDIDETLSFTLNTWLPEASRLFGNPENLTVKQFIKKYRYFKNIPYWHEEKVYEWLTTKIYDNKLQERIEVLENANVYVNEINKKVQIIAYITNRPEEIDTGTRNWLNMHKFPNVPIFSKPKYIHFSHAHEWKAQVVNFLYPNLQGIVDDNEEIINYLPSEYKGHIFLFNMNKYKKTKFNIYPCNNWPAVVEKINNIF